jgi:hypothetical protein
LIIIPSSSGNGLDSLRNRTRHRLYLSITLVLYSMERTKAKQVAKGTLRRTAIAIAAVIFQNVTWRRLFEFHRFEASVGHRSLTV